MGLGCGAKLAKMFLIVFNMIFFILGALAVGLSIWVLVDKTYLVTLTKLGNIDTYNVPGLLESGAYILIAGGGFIFIVGFFGCCGALKEIKIFLLLYAILVGLVLCAELAGGVVAYFYKDEVTAKLRTYLGDSLTQKYEGRWDTSEVFSLAWDYAHVTFDCCGINNSSDFSSATMWNRTVTVNSVDYTMAIPPSCCKIQDKSVYPSNVANIQLVDSNCTIAPSTTNSNANLGCYQAIYDTVIQYSTVVIGVGIGIAAVEILGIIFACCLVRAINEDENKVA